MSPGSHERYSGHNTGTIPKTKVRNNSNVPQEAVTPTRRDIHSSLGSTSLDWVPVSEYNSRSQYEHTRSQSRKPSNNIADQEFCDLENSVSFEGGLGRFVPVRPQPRVLPINMQQRDSLQSGRTEDEAGSSISSYSLHQYSHPVVNGVTSQVNHASAAVMIVNPTTPNVLSGNISQPFSVHENPNRNNLIRNINTPRQSSDSSSGNNSNNTISGGSHSRKSSKSVNLMNNMYDQAQTNSINATENSSVHLDSARALSEAMVAACPDAAAVERRLGQIREYIRVTSSLVDTMRNSEDEDVVVRPASSQSNVSIYSDNELWQNELKNKMEVSQQRLAALNQQQRQLLRYQAEAKHQLAEIQKARQSSSSLNDKQTQDLPANRGQHHHARIYNSNQIGVATTLPHTVDFNSHNNQPVVQSANLGVSNFEHSETAGYAHSNDDRLSNRETSCVDEVINLQPRISDTEEEESLTERGRQLTHKLRELQLKKQHMESLVTEFQKLQMTTRIMKTHSTYSSSGEESADEDVVRKHNQPDSNFSKNEDPFKLVEIKAIKSALQKTKDLMRSVENYETEHINRAQNGSYQGTSRANEIDIKSDGRGSTEDCSNDGSSCRVRNSIHHKLTNENSQQRGHEASIASLQELAQQLRQESERIMVEREQIQQALLKKEFGKKRKKVNEEIVGARKSPNASAGPGPVERRQMELRALLTDKQKQLEQLLKKEEAQCLATYSQNTNMGLCSGSTHTQYNSEQDEQLSNTEPLHLNSEETRTTDNFRISGNGTYNDRSITIDSSRVGSAQGSESGRTSGNKSNQRLQGRHNIDQQSDDNANQATASDYNIRHEQRGGTAVTNVISSCSQYGENSNNGTPCPTLTQPIWNNNKSNHDVRTNQFTQNSHSQTMEKILSTPQMPYPPTVPFNMMMPYGVVGSCACGCNWWGTWCWQQLAIQQREIHQLRDQLSHLEERWRTETASHTLNNQVPPGNRANNYWDNFRSYSRQNLLSANSKTNADGHLGTSYPHNPQPLVERSHNTLHAQVSTTPINTPKRKINAASGSSNTTTYNHQNLSFTNGDEIGGRHLRRNVTYERSHSFSSAPDVLNVNQNTEGETNSIPANVKTFEDTLHTLNCLSNININRGDTLLEHNLNISNSIPEIVQAHANNLISSANSFNNKKKSSSKLPAKNSTSRRTHSDFADSNNVNISNTTKTPNPNLASTSRITQDKATSKLFDLLRENVYSEVTALISVNESHPDFLIQLFRDLQMISSDSLRQQALNSIRNILFPFTPGAEAQIEDANLETSHQTEIVSTTTNDTVICNSATSQISRDGSGKMQNNVINFFCTKSEEICTKEILQALVTVIISTATEIGQTAMYNKKGLQEILSKYEGFRLSDVSGDILENILNMASVYSETVDSVKQGGENSDASDLQDVAGSLNLYSSSDSHLHQLNSCPYDSWTPHILMNAEVLSENLQHIESGRYSQDGKVDLINCTEMHNGDLAEADQTCHNNAGDFNNREEINDLETLPDVVENEESTPTEAEAEWLGLDRVPTRLPIEDTSENQKG